MAVRISECHSLFLGNNTVSMKKYESVNMQRKLKLLCLFPMEGIPCKKDGVLVVPLRALTSSKGPQRELLQYFLGTSTC